MPGGCRCLVSTLQPIHRTVYHTLSTPMCTPAHAAGLMQRQSRKSQRSTATARERCRAARFVAPARAVRPHTMLVPLRSTTLHWPWELHEALALGVARRHEGGGEQVGWVGIQEGMLVRNSRRCVVAVRCTPRSCIGRAARSSARVVITNHGSVRRSYHHARTVQRRWPARPLHQVPPPHLFVSSCLRVPPHPRGWYNVRAGSAGGRQ